MSIRGTFVVARESRGMTLNLGTLVAICGLVNPEKGAAVAIRTAATLQFWSADKKARTVIVNGWKSLRICSCRTIQGTKQKKFLAFLHSPHDDLLTIGDDFTSA